MSRKNLRMCLRAAIHDEPRRAAGSDVGGDSGRGSLVELLTRLLFGEAGQSPLSSCDSHRQAALAGAALTQFSVPSQSCQLGNVHA